LEKRIFHTKPTLGQILLLSFLGLAAALGLVFAIVLNETRASIMTSSERVREQASREIGERVVRFLATAPDTVAALQEQIKLRLIDANDPKAVETALFSLLLAKKQIGEISFTRADQTGFDENGAAQLAARPRWQISVVRSESASGEEQFWSRHVYPENSGFVAERQTLEPASSATMPPSTKVTAMDPTTHLTFATPASKEFQGELLWSDLHWSELDTAQRDEERTVEVSVQQTISDATGKFAGVARVGLLAEQLDRVVQLRLTSMNEHDPHRIFLCDLDGRLITRGVSSDTVTLSGDDLRLAPPDLPSEIVHALADSKLNAIGGHTRVISGHFRQNGREFLTTFRALPGTQDWLVGIVVPREFYLGKLVTIRNHMLIALSVVMLLLSAGAIAILRSIKYAQEKITRESLKMNAFDFSPTQTTSAFRDVNEVLESLEKAKTAMRAMGKYAPVDLVRKLYDDKKEPALGGELLEISIMFSDIKGFTSVSETLTPNQLARVLGLYLEELSRIIQRETNGTIDKYIGDAIMTIWNAPEPVPEHPKMACLAALRCCDAAAALGRTPDWRHLSPFQTRFGLHCSTALVGHFGARDRMNYTAIGDAVNLASRLETLNKQYGTSIIASESIFERARQDFDFRLLDIVAVRGKSKAIKVYELLGASQRVADKRELVKTYETAFTAYLARDFAGAMKILSRNETDAPSIVLRQRCENFLHAPPPADWNGVHISLAK
jgi:adenylate cyclase